MFWWCRADVQTEPALQVLPAGAAPAAGAAAAAGDQMVPVPTAKTPCSADWCPKCARPAAPHHVHRQPPGQRRSQNQPALAKPPLLTCSPKQECAKALGLPRLTMCSASRRGSGRRRKANSTASTASWRSAARAAAGDCSRVAAMRCSTAARARQDCDAGSSSSCDAT
jgi:hypothetical protein